MIRLTVMYNLAPGTDEKAFVKWRLGEHQASNLAIEGVVRTDFARVNEAWPEGAEVPYRFITTLDWPDIESFKRGFYDAGVQTDLQNNLKALSDPVFLISEILIVQRKELGEA